MNKNEYITLKKAGEGEYDEKKSRFLGFASPASNESDAISFISSIKKRFPDARHHVYAYITDTDGVINQRYSDDGEPQGTGGLPVFNVLSKQEIICASVVVVRYFGGVLLGASGLVRAYSKAASLAVNDAGISKMTLCVPLNIYLDYSSYQKAEHFFSEYTYPLIPPEFTDRVKSGIIVPVSQAGLIKNKLTDIFNGNIVIKDGVEEYYPLSVKSIEINDE